MAHAREFDLDERASRHGLAGSGRRFWLRLVGVFWQRRLSLSQILLMSVFLALLPTALLSIYLSFAGRNQARELIIERLGASAVATATTQRDSIALVHQNMLDLSANTVVRDSLPECNIVLSDALGTPSTASNFARVDAAGNLQCSAIRPTAALNVAASRWWQQGRDSGLLTFSDTQFGLISKRPIIIAMLPLRDSNGAFDGGLTAAIDASWVERLLGRRAESDDAIVALVDGSGTLLAANRDNGFALSSRFSGRQSGAATDENGREWLYASAPVWQDQLHIVYAEPLTPLVAPLTEQLRLTIALPIATIILTCLAIWFAMQIFAARWLGRLHHLIAQLGSGDYAVDLMMFRAAPADIAELAQDMHIMAQSIRERDTALRASADARLALVGEVNHRVKNNLQMIMSLISLQTAKVSEPVAKLALNQMRMRIGALALIYRSLYEDEGESEQGKVDVDRLMVVLASQLHMSQQIADVDIRVNSTVGVRPVDEVIPLAMFVVEILTNALRHGFPDARAGTIDLTISVDGGQTLVRVADNGIGYPTDGAAEEFGATLVAAYARQLGGTFIVDSDLGKGTVATLGYRSPSSVAA